MMAASVAGRDGQIAAGTGVFLVALPSVPPASGVRTAAWGGALAPFELHLSRSARLAARVAFFLAALVATAAVVVLLGSHRAEAATPPAGKAVPSDAPGSSMRVAPGGGRALTEAPTPVRKTSLSVVPGATGALAPVTQTLRPVVQQVAPAATSVTAPVTQTLRPLLQQVAPAATSVTAPVGQALRRIVPLGPGALRPLAQILGAVPQPDRLVLPPSTRSGTGPGPIGPPGGSPDVSLRPGLITAPPPVAAPGSPSMNGSQISWNGSSRTALGSRVAQPQDAPGLPAASAPFGGATAPTPEGSSGAGHGANGLLVTLLARWLSLGLLIFIVGLIALWSAGRPAPRPEVSPA
jgi:hypothetical protein